MRRRNMRLRTRVVLLAGFLAATVLVPSVTASALSCLAPVGTFVGRVVEINGGSVTFRTATFRPSGYSVDTNGVPTPTPGHLVVAHYGHDDEEFLHVGRRYSVTVWPGDKAFSADVATADESECGGGTVNADGSQIDTALVHQPHVRRLVFELLLASAVVALAVAAWAARKRRRQHRNVEGLVNPAS
jgi:hypothetical protein